MKRVRWLQADWPISMSLLALRMKDYAFLADSSEGFVIDKVRNDYLKAHYIEKIPYQETIVDPFGKEILFERVDYKIIDFSLFSKFPNIEIVNAHRNTREFISKLMELCDFSLSIEPISINPLTWVAQLESALEHKVIIDSIQISGLEIEPEINAKLLLKGTKDVRPALDNLYSKKKFELEKLQLKIKTNGSQFPIQLTNTGTAKLSEGIWEELLPKLRNGLSTLDLA